MISIFVRNMPEIHHFSWYLLDFHRFWKPMHQYFCPEISLFCHFFIIFGTFFMNFQHFQDILKAYASLRIAQNLSFWAINHRFRAIFHDKCPKSERFLAISRENESLCIIHFYQKLADFLDFWTIIIYFCW